MTLETFVKITGNEGIWKEFVSMFAGGYNQSEGFDFSSKARENFANEMNKKNDVFDLSEEDYTIIDENKELELK